MDGNIHTVDDVENFKQLMNGILCYCFDNDVHSKTWTPASILGCWLTSHSTLYRLRSDFILHLNFSMVVPFLYHFIHLFCTHSMPMLLSLSVHIGFFVLLLILLLLLLPCTFTTLQLCDKSSVAATISETLLSGVMFISH